ncbi:SDR family oxidoreductase [Microbacterium sp. H83]|uniref:SDR family oxidoreductase n=1 Tax=Microbacterium sp. H83 TaxID=1827324 RepID=UPI0007F36162|nr:NAD(P)H-binding protein [Microbacterium sp. H83]OAN42764.1 3-beta hydroxysteroid dehydrogenase [Microbacterium sp. H83]
MRIVVAGGTGLVGRHTVEAARERGHDVTVLARSRGADVLTGSGLTDAVAGADALIDVTNITTLSATTATEFFETATRNMLAAEEKAGVAHHVALSIVGIDGIDASYYAGKLAQERMVAASAVPSTIARAGQFHEFAGQLLAQQHGSIAVMPTLLMRPVAAREVGEHLVRVAEAGPVGRAQDIVGPRDEILVDVARRQVAADGIRRAVLQLRLPGAYGRGLASGSLRGTPDALQGELTFDDWLATH